LLHRSIATRYLGRRIVTLCYAADVAITESEITVRFHRRARLPIVLASGLIDKPVKVPWWSGRSLRLIQ
jgi:hypothetical protein